MIKDLLCILQGSCRDLGHGLLSFGVLGFCCGEESSSEEGDFCSTFQAWGAARIPVKWTGRRERTFCQFDEISYLIAFSVE
jgi:hypothetical protein